MVVFLDRNKATKLIATQDRKVGRAARPPAFLQSRLLRDPNSSDKEPSYDKHL
jgi:hypothetical protein